MSNYTKRNCHVDALAALAAAQDIIDNRENYVADKVALMDKTSNKTAANRGNAMLASIDIVSNTGIERIMMSVDLK